MTDEQYLFEERVKTQEEMLQFEKDYLDTICNFAKALPPPDPPRILYIDKDVPRWKHWFIKRKVKRKIKRGLI